MTTSEPAMVGHSAESARASSAGHAVQHVSTTTTALQLVHHYMQGLRFEGSWTYHVTTPFGRKHWHELPPLDVSEHFDSDPQGAWWCMRRCMAVLERRAWRSSPALPSEPLLEVAEMVVQLQALLPNHRVHTSHASGKPLLHQVAEAMQNGGCALVRFVSTSQAIGTSQTHWLWAVGAETQRLSVQCQSHSTTVCAKGRVGTILVVGQAWPAPWGSGFGARLGRRYKSTYALSSVDGQRLRGSCVAVMILPAA